jgi:hypothetical protein
MTLNSQMSCACCSPALSRRSMLKSAAGLGLASAMGLGALAPSARAASGHYEAMLVNCIDPRFTTLSHRYMGMIAGVEREKLGDVYSQFVIAGGPLGAVHPAFKNWHNTFWDNLDITVKLHHIQRVVAISHRDCGAAKLAFGEDGVKDKATETESHGESLAQFRAAVRKRHPKLSVITGIMDLSGRVDLLG